MSDGNCKHWDQATFVSEEAGGFPGTAGCFSEEHVSGWKEVTDRVHAKGGAIFLRRLR